jgi:membrane associated rhomboid family serine protease
MVYFFFYFPIGTDVALKRRPWASIALLAINVAAYLVTHWIRPLGPQLLYALSWKPAQPSLVTAVTSCFLHAGLFHLLGNMIYLAFLGPPVEDRLGKRRFLALYLVSGAAAMVAQALVLSWRSPDLMGTPVVGASGAVAGVLGAFLVRLPGAHIRVAAATLFMLHGVNRVSIKYVPAVIAVAAWVALQLAYALAWADARTAYWAHLGGLLIGAGIALAGGAWLQGRLERHRQRAVRYIEQGSFYAAVGELESMFTLGHTTDAEAFALHGRALVAAGRRAPAIQGFRRAIGLAIAQSNAPGALRIYLEMQRLLPASVLEPREQLQIVRALRAEGEYEAAAVACDDFTTAYAGHAKAELVRLLAIEIRAELLGDRDGAAALCRAADPRRIGARWQARLLGRRAGEV